MPEAAIHSPGSISANTRQASLTGGWFIGLQQEVEQTDISIDVLETNQNTVPWQYHMHAMQMQMWTLKDPKYPYRMIIYHFGSKIQNLCKITV